VIADPIHPMPSPTMRLRSAVERLKLVCRAWGGNLIVMPRETFQRLDWGPSDPDVLFTSAPAAGGHGLNWRAKLVFTTFEDADAGAIIHEMGHVFASPVNERKCDEFDWLGWEICLARQVGAYKTWSKQNAGYYLGNLLDGAGEWGAITPVQEREVIRDRIQHGKKLGIIDRQGRARAIR
jgi:hypothetical protein